MDGQMELELRQIISKYRTRRGLSFAVLAAGIAYFLYLTIFKLDYRLGLVFGGVASVLLTVSVFLVFFIVWAAAMLLSLTAVNIIVSVLTDRCDPYLYEACLIRTAGPFYRDRLECNRAVAQYAQGNFARAFETLQHVNVYKLKGQFRLNYYTLLSDIYFCRGMGMQVTELEKAYRAGMKDSKKEQKYFQRFCMSNNVTRAMENKDYKKAFEFLCGQRELNAGEAKLWNRVAFSYIEAKIYQGLGEDECARLKLAYVVKNGGKLFYAAKAQEMLKKYDFPCETTDVEQEGMQKEVNTNEEVSEGI